MGLGERLNGIQEVIGSIPIISTKNPETFGFRIFSFLKCNMNHPRLLFAE